MESLKSGDVPALVTNMELMDILSKRLVKRKEEEEEATTLEDGSNIKCSTTNSQQNQGKLRHRDYIEESVYEYLAHSSCASADFKKMPEFGSKRRGAGMRKITKKTKEQQNAGKVLKTEEGAIGVSVETPICDSEQNDTNIVDQNYGLTDAETLQTNRTRRTP